MNLRRMQTAAISPRSSIGSLRAQLAAGRTVWFGITALSLTIFVAGIPIRLQQLQSVCGRKECVALGLLSPEGVRALHHLGLSVGFYAAYNVALGLAFGLSYFTIAGLIYWHKSHEGMGLFVSLALVLFGATYTDFDDSLILAHPIWTPLVRTLSNLGFVAFFIMFYIFPNGRFVPRWTRWLAIVWIALQLSPLFPYLPLDPESWPSLLRYLVFFGLLASALFAAVYRYRRVSGPVEREQTRWVVFGTMVAIIGFLGVGLLDLAFGLSTSPISVASLLAYTLIYCLLLLVPVSLSIAILRHRLFDIDVIINRTLVYGALTACVVGLYVLVVGGLGVLLQIGGNLWVSLLGAGLVAILFAPLRDRLQRGVNRLMYGERDDPYGVISRLGERLGAVLTPDTVLPTFVETVRDALRLPYAAIALEQGGAPVTVASTGTPVASPVRLPLVYQGEEVGELMLVPRVGEQGFAPADRRLLETLARQAGIAAHAVRLATALQQSRERLVTAREEERRRLRRDLHDGLGPTLGGLALKLDIARGLTTRDPARADALLLDLKAQAQSAVVDIRRLVHQLRPPALDELGLVGALREVAANYGGSDDHLRITIDAPELLPPLPAAVEVAAYRIAQEAVTNVVRHAGARRCIMSLRIEEAAICMEIVDDGAGLPAERRLGVGLLGMRERAEELGGTCTIESPATGGTVVHARLPHAPSGAPQVGD